MSESSSESLFRELPAVNRLIETIEIQALLRSYPRDLVLEELNLRLDNLRKQISEGALDRPGLRDAVEHIPSDVTSAITLRMAPSLRPLINATGVVVYTNAGRSPLASAALTSAAAVSSVYSNLEYDLQNGCRGHRDQHFERRAAGLLHCEAATVCNNAAAALLLILNSLALGKKVLVSRGELIEIGGSFRLPAVMEKSGAILKEVGTTNKTHLTDYRDAIDEDTALILRVHPSNYQVVGFTHRPELGELTELAKQTGIPLVHDVGSGLLFPSEHPFLASEPVVSTSLAAGSDLVCFSGDKLLGGPQAGLIVGRRDLVSQLRKNPLMRALRVDKLTYSALEWTLLEYERGTFRESLPIWRFMELPVEVIRKRAETLSARLTGLGFEVETQPGESVTGGGTAPEERIPTCLLAVTSRKLSPNEIESGLRKGALPVLTRIEKDRVLLDLRTVFPEQDGQIFEAFEDLLD